VLIPTIEGWVASFMQLLNEVAGSEKEPRWGFIPPGNPRALRDTALVPVPPLGKNRAGRACGLCNVSDCSLPVAALRLWQRTTEGEFYGELSAPAPDRGQWPYVCCGFRCYSGCLHRAGAEAETLGVMPSVPKRTPYAGPTRGIDSFRGG
jgi:hypothetical protein